MTKLGLMARLAVILSLGSGGIVLGSLPAIPQEAGNGERGVGNGGEQFVAAPHSPPSTPSSLSELEQPATTIEAWIAQIEASLVQITNVRLEETEAGLQVILETAEGELSISETRTVGNALIADIPNAAIAEEFSQAEPIEGIALVSVTSLPGDRVRVAITGTDAPPVAEVTATGLSVTLGEAVAGTEDEAIQVVVTGEQDEGYNPSSATTATRTDTPLRDIPQSIQVVPQQVLEDQQVTNLGEALRNVPGVSQGGNSSTRGLFAVPTIRGFSGNNDILTNGLRDPDTNLVLGFNSATIERIEVLRGPASVLYGQGSIGGVVNLVTRQPLTDPYYSIEASAGSFDFYRGVIDLSGPLTENETLLYRLIGSAQTTESFIDFFDRQDYIVAPTLTWLISDRTQLTLTAEYIDRSQDDGQVGVPAVGTVLPNPNGEIPRDRNLAEPSTRENTRAFRGGYDFEHRLSENWQLRSALRLTDYDRDIQDRVFPFRLEPDNRTVARLYFDGSEGNDYINFDNYVVGDFTTGSIQHQLTVGVNYTRRERRVNVDSATASTLDIFDPIYDQPLITDPIPDSNFEFVNNSYGFYIQDQITFAENLKLLVGGRFDVTNWRNDDFISGDSLYQIEQSFSPRIGIVYQPIPAISLYASYSQSFLPPQTEAFQEITQPERGTQYEVGIKADLSDQLAATLAFYDLTRSNVSTSDPNNPLRSIQVGEQQSRGIEFDLSGEILPGWNIIGGYALTDTEVVEDNTFEVGNQLANVPRHSASLWTTYEIQSGNLQGLGFGIGLFFVGDRQGDLANTFELPSYLRSDAAIFYERDRFRAALNFKNLFDIDYFDSASSRTNVYRGDPFIVQGTISWQF